MTELAIPGLSAEAIEAFHKLPAKEQRFILEHRQCGNYSEAYRRAFNARGWSPHAVAVEASRLAKKPEISLILGSAQDAAIAIIEDTIARDALRLEQMASLAEDTEASAAKLAVAHRAISTKLEVAGLTGRGAQVNVNIGIDNRAIELWQQGGAAAWRDTERARAREGDGA